MRKYIESLETKRSKNIFSQFPYGNHLNLIDTLEKEINCYPHLNELNKDEDLYRMLWNNMISPTEICLKDKPQMVLNELKEIDNVSSMVYDLDLSNENDAKLNRSDLIKNKFRQHFEMPDSLFKN
jgi:hypothetical protein